MGVCEDKGDKPSQNIVHSNYVPLVNIKKVFNSIVKIELDNGKNSTGFFMIIELKSKEMKCLFTSRKMISDDDINNKIAINLYSEEKGKKEAKKIKLDKNIRFIKTFNEDIIIIEIIKDDNISDDKYLYPDLNYIDGYNKMMDNNIFLAGYPINSDEKFISSGKIKKIKSDYTFEHNLDTKIGSYGSPIFNETSQVVGIHTSFDEYKAINNGIFIEEIIKALTICNDISNDSNNNYITADIYISDYNAYKDIRIINSYEQSKREFPTIKEDYKNENEKEIQENCEIKVDDKIIPFSYFCKFKSKKKYKITYTFKNKLKNINYLFYGCNFLTNLNLSNFNTQNVTNMESMFSCCRSLTNLNLSNLNTQNVNNMESMFSYCRSLKSLNLSNFNTQNVTNMKYMFFECNSLTNVNLSNFNTQKVTNMEYMFSWCNSLENLDLSSFNTPNVSNMKSMFSWCNSLKNINLSNFNTQNNSNMDSMFTQCNSLKNINLSNFNTQNVTNMAFMFSSCSSLTNLNLSNFNTGNVVNMKYMFYECKSLKNLNLSNFNAQKVTNMEYLFKGNNSLTNLNLSSFNIQSNTHFLEEFKKK